jgi:hypothetical protein
VSASSTEWWTRLDYRCMLNVVPMYSSVLKWSPRSANGLQNAFEFGISPGMPNFGEFCINLAKNCRLQTDTLDKQPVPSIYFVVKLQVSTVQVWKQVHGHDKCRTHPNLETSDRVITSSDWL